MQATALGFSLAKVVKDMEADGNTVYDIVGKLGIDQAEVSKILRHGYEPDVGMNRSHRIAARLGKSPEQLLAMGRVEGSGNLTMDYQELVHA